MFNQIYIYQQFNYYRNSKGEFIGSIGVSGGSVEEDLEIARAAAEAVKNM